MANIPAYILYHGKATGKDKTGKKIWTRIGAVWTNKSGKGFNVTWDYLPLSDGVTVMLPYDKRQDDMRVVTDESVDPLSKRHGWGKQPAHESRFSILKGFLL